MSTAPFSRRTWLLGSLLALVPAPAAAHPITESCLFIITRSNNANLLRYDVRVSERGRLDLRTPLEVYWIMHAEDGRREGLTWLEKKFAYGVELTSPVRRSGFRVRLAAFDTRDVLIERGSDLQYRAYFSIAGRRSVLQRIHVQTDEGGFTPSVRHVDLFGVAATGGARLSERWTP